MARNPFVQSWMRNPIEPARDPLPTTEMIQPARRDALAYRPAVARRLDDVRAVVHLLDEPSDVGAARS